MAATAVAIFIALFATVYIQMASGRDPALGTSVTTAAITESTTSSETTTTDDTAVTTAQS